MLTENMQEEEIKMIEKQYAEHFYKEPYYVCCQNHEDREVFLEENYILIENIEKSDAFIVPEEKRELLLKNELQNGYVGVSALHEGICELRKAYTEAALMRKKAFLRNRMVVHWEDAVERIPEKLIEEAEKLTDATAKLQRVQLLGTEHTEELEKVWKQFFFEVKNGRIGEAAFEDCMEDFLTETEKTYRNVLGTQAKELEDCKAIWDETCIDTYEEKLMNVIFALHEKINHQFDVNRNTQKMKLAVEYIEKNYASDLNMAVVSNYISMNYSLFSYSFKQYTGSNFVNFLKEIRMREAKKLLANTDKKIIEISQEVGYDNEKHFMKIFKATCGVSPTEYRKNASLFSADTSYGQPGQTTQ